MKIKELADLLNKADKSGFGDCDACVILHNTAHQIDNVCIPTEKDCRVITIYRKTSPSYFMNSLHHWISI
jgi:hypothetical protein